MWRAVRWFALPIMRNNTFSDFYNNVVIKENFYNKVALILQFQKPFMHRIILILQIHNVKIRPHRQSVSPH